MDALLLNTAVRVQAKQEQQKSTHDTTARNCSFSIGQSVLVRNFAAGERWIPGHIIEHVGPVSFMIELEDGRMFKQHQDHIRNRLTSLELSDIPKNSSDFMDFPYPAAESQQSSSNMQLAQAVSEPVELHGNNSGTGPEELVSRYPRRAHKPPDRFIDSQHSLN